MAAKAPKVQTLAQAMADLNPAYAASKKIVQQQISGLGTKYASQRAGINAARGEGFNTINNQATGRGGSFSGIPQDEQATYLSTKYLPGMLQADYQENADTLALQGDIAGLNKEQRLAAMDTVKGQKSDLNTWNLQRMQQEFQASEAAKSRAFDASQAAADRAFKASQSAAEQQGPSNSQIISKLNSWTKGKTGSDMKLSPSDFKAGYQVAAKYGMSVDDYVAVMQRYVNTSHAKDYAF